MSEQLTSGAADRRRFPGVYSMVGLGQTLLQVKLEDIAACEEIFTTLMGEDVESRRKFIEENALDVKNLDI